MAAAATTTSMSTSAMPTAVPAAPERLVFRIRHDNEARRVEAAVEADWLWRPLGDALIRPYLQHCGFSTRLDGVIVEWRGKPIALSTPAQQFSSSSLDPVDLLLRLPSGQAAPDSLVSRLAGWWRVASRTIDESTGGSAAVLHFHIRFANVCAWSRTGQLPTRTHSARRCAGGPGLRHLDRRRVARQAAGRGVAGALPGFAARGREA